MGRYLPVEILERVHDPIFITDERGRVELCNSAANGRFKEAVCRKALVVLGEEGFIHLPRPAKTFGSEASWKIREPVLTPAVAIDCGLEELGHVEIQMITSRYTKLSRIWNNLMDSYHYLGSGPLCGAQLRYLIHSSVHGHIGGASFSSCAWALGKRDEFIGWTQAAHRRTLQRVVCYSRFPIKPTVRVPNLASRVLGQCCRRIGSDWGSRYGIEPVLLETFVDPKRFSGASYRAANWIHVGQTSGRRGAQREAGDGAKEIFLYPLCDDWQKILSAEAARRLREKPQGNDFDDWVEDEFATELEPVRRGPYTGSFGYIGWNGDLDLNIVIRTLVWCRWKGYLQVGAGIVADSDPAKEYEETLQKAQAFFSALQQT